MVAKKHVRKFVGKRLKGEPIPIALVEIDGDPTEVIRILDYGYLPTIEVSDKDQWGKYKEYVVAATVDEAVTSVRRYWDDMATHDPAELAELVGRERIVEFWTTGTSFEDFVDLVLADGLGHNIASYDGAERDLKVLEVYNEDWYDQIHIDEGGEGLAFRTS